MNKRPGLPHDVLIADLSPNEATCLLSAFRAAAIVARAHGTTAVRVPANRNRMFAAKDVAQVVDEALPTRTTRLCGQEAVPFGERPPATQFG